MQYTEIIIPSGKNVGDQVVYLGKRYKIVEKLDFVHINQLLCHALGEEVGDY